MTSDKISESDLCKEFKEWLRSRGFVVYPEVSDWDLVAVRDAERQFNIGEGVDIFHVKTSNLGATQLAWKPDTQIGIQAKLQANIDVLYQAAVARVMGPRLRTVLVRRADGRFIGVARALGLSVAVREYRSHRWSRVSEWRQHPNGFLVYNSQKVWDTKQLWLPPVTTDLPAGTPSPIQLTEWRVKALKLCRIGRDKGYLTSKDFKTAGVDMKRWVTCDWMRDTGEKVEGLKTYRLTETAPDIGWEEISEQIHKTLENPNRAAV